MRGADNNIDVVDDVQGDDTADGGADNDACVADPTDTMSNCELP